MQILFLNSQTLKVIDYGYATDDFEIVLDALIPQKSSFTINKKNLNAFIGDFLVVREHDYFYIGIITSIEAEKESNLKVATRDFLSKFDVEVPVSSFSGDVSQFLLNLINTHFFNSGDSHQNLPYLQTQNMASKQGILTYEPDKTKNILDLVEEFSKTFSIRLSYELVVMEGIISKIKVSVVPVSKGITFRSDLGTISNLTITDTDDNAINKIIFQPKSENVTHQSTISYFLLTEGTITTNGNSTKRFEKVNFKYEYYSDSDYDSLLTKATTSLVNSSLEHNITFDFAFSSNKIASLEELTLGTFVVFITPEKTYETMVTKMTYKGTFNVATIVLGEHRVTLTDKLKLLDRRGT